MHLFYSASQIIQKMVILVDLSAIFLASPLSILAWELKQMAWLSKLAQSFLDLLLSCLSQTKHPRTIMSTAC